MSEFRVVKCRKCTAPLVELPGETLTYCVQCGYKFSNVSQTRLAAYTSMTSADFSKQGKLQELSATKTTHQSSDNMPHTNTTTHFTKTTKSTKVQLPVSNKKSTPAWAIILKWYIIISVFTGIIMGMFR
ncbi:MAG: hypothetical protein L3J53_04465 [Proteobacteria bacterium]|nr:hypothetical protein [Pseudomonadota bacterium]